MKKIIGILLIVALLVGLFFIIYSCVSGDEEGADSITNLKYNGETISWTSVNDAKNYKVNINGAESIIAQASGTVTMRYDSKGEDFDFSIEAVIEEGSDENPTYAIRFTNIGQVKNLKLENGILVWDALATAEKYEIMYNGDIVSSDVGTNKYEASVGAFSYKVRGLKGQAESVDGNNAYFSIWSDSLTGEILTAPTNLNYDSEKFTWDKVDNATSYVIKIGGEEFTTTQNRYNYAAGKEDFSVSVLAVGDESKNVYRSKYCDEKKYTYIAPIEGLNVVDGVLKWTASENAVGYRVKVNGIVLNEDLKTNEFAAISSGNSYRIQILPIGKSDFYFSTWSSEITVNILRSPVVSYGDSVIKWGQVAGASGYELRITKGDEVIYTTSVGEEVFVYNYAFEDAGEYSVQVKATSLGVGGVYESKFSAPYSVRRLGTPTNEVIENRPLEQNQVSVSFTPCAGATGYSLLANGAEIATIKTGSTFSVDLSKLTGYDESTVNFKIVAKGGVTSTGAILESSKVLEFTVTKLATPQNLVINGTQLSWDAVNRTSKYVLTIDGKRTEVTTTSFTLTELAAGTHSIYVQAMGNGSEVITGGFSNELEIKKLATPSALNIKDGLISWGQVSGATAYKVILGTETYNTDTTSFDLEGYISSIQEGQGTQISVYAIGNGSNVIDSDVSATRTISRYARPTNVQVNGDVLVWNPSSLNSVNCNQYIITIVDMVNFTTNTVIVTGTSYQMSNFAAGNYTVSVVALGDNVNTLNSPDSAEFVFTKLGNITNLVKNGATISWDEVLNANGYEYKLSKDATWVRITENSISPVFNTEGEFEISIRALGNGINVISSDIYSFTQRVRRLTQPVIDDTMSNVNAFKVEVSGNLVTVTVKKQSGAIDYKMYVGGIERDDVISESDTEIVFQFVMTTVGASYSIQVQAVGGEFDQNGNYMMDSNKSTEYHAVYQN